MRWHDNRGILFYHYYYFSFTEHNRGIFDHEVHFIRKIPLLYTLSFNLSNENFKNNSHQLLNWDSYHSEKELFLSGDSVVCILEARITFRIKEIKKTKYRNIYMLKKSIYTYIYK